MTKTIILSARHNWPDLDWALSGLDYRLSSDPLETVNAEPALVILDGDMGLDLCPKLKNSKANPKLLVFNKQNLEGLHLMALVQGADDWISTNNLTLFRTKVTQLIETTRTNRFLENTRHRVKIWPDSYLITKDDKQLTLPRKEFELLALLMSQPKKLWSRAEILERIWPDSHSLEGTLNVHIRRLRAKLGADLIRCQTGMGYGISL